MQVLVLTGHQRCISHCDKAVPQTSDVGIDKRRGGDSGDSGVATMTAVTEDCGGGQQQQRQTTTVVDDDGKQDWVAKYNREG
jgi:hypothetical protein